MEFCGFWASKNKIDQNCPDTCGNFWFPFLYPAILYDMVAQKIFWNPFGLSWVKRAKHHSKWGNSFNRVYLFLLQNLTSTGVDVKRMMWESRCAYNGRGWNDNIIPLYNTERERERRRGRKREQKVCVSFSSLPFSRFVFLPPLFHTVSCTLSLLCLTSKRVSRCYWEGTEKPLGWRCLLVATLKPWPLRHAHTHTHTLNPKFH